MPSRIPSYRLHKASRQAVVVLNGKSHYLGLWNSPESRVEYDRLVAEWLTDDRRKRLRGVEARRVPSDVTVNELLLAFLDYYETNYRTEDGRATRHLGNLKDSLRFVQSLYGSTLAREFGPLALRTVRDEMIQTGLCRRTINDRVNRIRRCFRWATSVEILRVEVVQALETVEPLMPGRSGARESLGVKPVPIADVEAVLPHLAPAVAAMVEVQLRSGCRAGEVVLMRGAELDMMNPVWTYRPRQHKNSWRGRDRVILIGPRAQKIIKGFLKPTSDIYLFSPRECVEAFHAERAAKRGTKRTPSELARVRKQCPRRPAGERYTSNTYRQAIVRACVRMGIAPWSPLQLRHTAATAVRKEYGVEGAQLILGHQPGRLRDDG